MPQTETIIHHAAKFELNMKVCASETPKYMFRQQMYNIKGKEEQKLLLVFPINGIIAMNE